MRDTGNAMAALCTQCAGPVDHRCRGRSTHGSVWTCRIFITKHVGRFVRHQRCAVSHPGWMRSAPGGIWPRAVPDVWALWGRLSRFVPLVGFFADQYPVIARAHSLTTQVSLFCGTFFCSEAGAHYGIIPRRAGVPTSPGGETECPKGRKGMRESGARACQADLRKPDFFGLTASKSGF